MDYGVQESQLGLHCCILKIHEFILCYHPLVPMFIVKRRLAFPAERICYQKEGGQRPGVEWKCIIWAMEGAHVINTKWSIAISLYAAQTDLRYSLALAQNQLRKESCFSGAWFVPTGTDFCYSPPHSPVVRISREFLRRIMQLTRC